jgi:UDP-N-acetylmuramate--alanine ligase
MKKLFFVGIGGIGMSSLALYAQYKRYIVSGCDSNTNNKTVSLLKKKGINVQEEENVTEEDISLYDTLIITNTITEEHPLFIMAQKQNKVIYLRSQFLQKLLTQKKIIAITGSHGKTTTTAIMGDLLTKMHKKPTVFVGGIYKEYETNILINNTPFTVIEADDAYKSFLDIKSSLVSIITSISQEHLETYSSIEDIISNFYNFASHIDKRGILIINNDQKNTQTLIQKLRSNNFKNIITYGTEQNSDYRIENIQNKKNRNYFSLRHQGSLIGQYATPLKGLVNIKNTTSVIIAAHFLNMQDKKIKKHLLTFKGVERRFDYIGLYKNIAIYDDYGHHPTEIEALFDMIKEKKVQANIFFQPHKYIRTKHLWNEFITVFIENKNQIENLFITDVYAINEEYDPKFNSKNLVDEIKKIFPKAYYIPFDKNFSFFEEPINTLEENKNIIITLGAGLMHLLAQKLSTKKL